MSNDLRLRDFFGKRTSVMSQIHLLEFPSDQGVSINGGRPGSAKAPELIRAALGNLTPHATHYQKHTDIFERTQLAGVIPCDKEVETDQKRLAAAVSDRLKTGIMPIVLGGGHETAFGHFLGYAQSDMPVTIINIDAHADVRPLKNGKAHSGSSFRQAVDHDSGLCSSYHVFGLNPSSVSLEHFHYVKKCGAPIFDYETTQEKIQEKLQETEGNIMISMDMDAVSQADAPGVSAPNTSGISKDLWLNLAFSFGKCSKVTSFDICEVNPLFDRDGQTVKLAALTIWSFLLGYSMR